MSTTTTPSSSPPSSPTLTALTTSTPPTSPSSSPPPSPHLFTTPLSLQLSTTLPSLNRALLRAYNLALAYVEVGSPQHQKLKREAAALVEEMQHHQRHIIGAGARAEPVGARERRTNFGHGWESRYPNFGKNDPPVLAKKTEKTEKKGTKRGADEAELGKGDVDVEEGRGKRVRRMSDKARETVRRGVVDAGRGGTGKKRGKSV